ncbi:MAG: hypothetical protein V2I33_16295 [Kangiellaceae bacterium]|jgi:hypothetical protein|nr:hypothetical protein [Kangiellaceae bacterium]
MSNDDGLDDIYVDGVHRPSKELRDKFNKAIDVTVIQDAIDRLKQTDSFKDAEMLASERVFEIKLSFEQSE